MVVIGQKLLYSGKKWLYSGKVAVFVQKWFKLGKSGCIRVKVIISEQGFLFRAIVVLFGQSCCIRAKVVVFG